MKKIFTGLLAAALVCPAPASARARRARNPKRARKPAAAARQAPKPRPQVLAPGRWNPAAYAALEDFIIEKGSSSARYDPRTPPVVVLPWDDAAVSGDPAAAVFQKLVESVDFKFDDEFWQAVPPAHGRQRLRAYYEQFAAEPQSVWARQGSYQAYRKGFFAVHRVLARKVGRRESRVWLSELLCGFKPEELAAYADAVIKEEEARPLESEVVKLAPDDPLPVEIRRGLRPLPEMRDLARALLAHGFDVWVVADTPQAVLETAARGYGVDASRVLGVKNAVKDGKLTGEILDPVPVRSGKVDALVSRLGRAPALALGSETWDAELLEYGTGLRLVLDRGDPTLRALAKERGWLVQEAFAPIP